jgi:hypothetical protein
MQATESDDVSTKSTNPFYSSISSFCQLSSRVYAGFLEKRGEGLIKRWKKRWFAIKKDQLCYSEFPRSKVSKSLFLYLPDESVNSNHRLHQILGVIPLGNCSLDRQPAPDNALQFNIKVGKGVNSRVYEIQAPSFPEKNQWTQVVSNAIRYYSTSINTLKTVIIKHPKTIQKNPKTNKQTKILEKPTWFFF